MGKLFTLYVTIRRNNRSTMDPQREDDMSSSSNSTNGKKKANGKDNPFATIANTSDIDYIGNGPFQVSQLNILQKRSVEPF